MLAYLFVIATYIGSGQYKIPYINPVIIQSVLDLTNGLPKVEYDEVLPVESDADAEAAAAEVEYDFYEGEEIQMDGYSLTLPKSFEGVYYISEAEGYELAVFAPDSDSPYCYVYRSEEKKDNDEAIMLGQFYNGDYLYFGSNDMEKLLESEASLEEITSLFTFSEGMNINDINESYIVINMEPYDLYPITTVNKRSEPSTDSEIVGQVTIKDTVTVVGTVSSYKGYECSFYKTSDGVFISAPYLSVEKTEEYVLPSYYVPIVKEGIEYYTCGNEITLPSGGYNINTEYIGLKVIWTNKALLGTTNARYTADTYNAVVNLQTQAGLPVTGEVNLDTWLAMGYTEEDWYGLGTYVTPLKVSAGATHAECVEAMLETAVEYMNAGTDYRIGSSGVPGSYADCSGFVFQLLYSIGVNPTINIVDHALAVKEYTSRDLCADDRLGIPVSYEDMQAGDLIFYSSNGYNVTHVGMYAGGGKMYDSNSGGVKLRNIWARYSIVKIVRVCPD